MKKLEPVSDLVRYLKLIQEPGKLELLVLRAHMLFEEQLRALIDEYLPVPNNFRHEIFGFSQCLSLVKAIHWKPSNEWVAPASNLIASKRNTTALSSQIPLLHRRCLPPPAQTISWPRRRGGCLVAPSRRIHFASASSPKRTLYGRPRATIVRRIARISARHKFCLKKRSLARTEKFLCSFIRK